MTAFTRLFAPCLVLSLSATFGIARAATLYVGAGETYTTIQSAINASSNGDLIIVRDGTYTGPGNRDIEFKGKAIHVKSENGPEHCKVDGQASAQDTHRVFFFRQNEGNGSILEGFTITGGYAGGGSGILCSASSPTITGNVIARNTSTYHGGGILIDGASTALVVGNTIIENTATEWGGGVHAWYSAPTVTGNTIAANRSHEAGGVACWQGGALISDNVITGNVAFRDIDGSGGGILYFLSTNIIVGNTVMDNQALLAGGIHCRDCSPVVTMNTVIGNTAFGSGGGIRCQWCSPTITGNRIIGNAAGTYGGGIFSSEHLSKPVITNCLIAGNTAPQGAGIGVKVAAASVALCTITGNTAGTEGGAVWCSQGGASPIANSILWGNSMPEVAIAGGSSLSIAWCDVGGGTGTISVEPGSTLSLGSGNINADPLFADPANRDYHLLSKCGRWDPQAGGGVGGWAIDRVTSPCIDAGDPAAAFSLEPLPNGGRVNMGVYGNTAEASRNSPFVALLSVSSSPYGGIYLSGTYGDTTPYTRVFFAPVDAVFSAQLRLFRGSDPYNFAYWTIGGVAQQPRQTDLHFRVEADIAIEAVYNILGDANGDCVVNVLDLIAIRNRLGKPIGSADNWKADVNLDGAVDVLDLISARNRLGTRCE